MSIHIIYIYIYNIIFLPYSVSYQKKKKCYFLKICSTCTVTRKANDNSTQNISHGNSVF